MGRNNPASGESALSKKLFFAAIAIGLLFSGFHASQAHAAPLTYDAPTTISLTSPATTLTIASGSVADALQVNATSVMVTLSSSTDGGFTLTSASYDLAVASSSAGGSAAVSCTAGVETAALSQNTGSSVYTVTPTTSNCANSSPPVITNIATSSVTANSATVSWTTNVPATTTVEYGTGVSYGSSVNDADLTAGDSVTLSGLTAGTTYHFAVIASADGTSTTSGDNTFITSAVSSGGGEPSGVSVSVPSQYGQPFTSIVGATSTGTPTTASAIGSSSAVSGASTTALEAELQSLLAELATLERRATASSTGVSSAAFPLFSIALHLGSSGSAVSELQRFLALNPAIYPQGEVTGYFGTLTLKAVQRFQSKYGIAKPGEIVYGYVGPATRAKLNALIKQGLSP
jgi:hypothetical protein